MRVPCASLAYQVSCLRTCNRKSPVKTKSRGLTARCIGTTNVNRPLHRPTQPGDAIIRLVSGKHHDRSGQPTCCLESASAFAAASIALIFLGLLLVLVAFGF